MPSDITIRLNAKGDFELTIPSDWCDKSHTVTIPCSEAGAFAMQHVLQKQRWKENRRGKIGEEDNPTQYIVDEWLKHNKPKTLTEDGMDITGIELDLELDLTDAVLDEEDL